MNMKFLKKLTVVTLVGFVAVSCNKDLNVKPIVGTNPSNVYDNLTDISGVMAKVYGGLTLSGSTATTCDLGSYDAGTSVLYRIFWYGEEMSADQVKMSWNDGNLPDLCTDTWTPDNDKLHLLYDRAFYQISVCNEFLRNLPASKVNSFSSSDAATIKNYVAEARFIRALTYWMAMDCFGNIPFATEASSVGTTPPKQATRQQVYNYIVSELYSIQSDLLAPASNYGRADQACAWYLLAKVYLNAKVYTGTAHYDSAAYFCQKIMNAGYTLAPNYANLFRIDNQTTSKQEIIFPLRANGVTSQSYGNSTFLICASIGGVNHTDSNVTSVAGTSGAWAGYRATPNLDALFPNLYTTSDVRGRMIDSEGQTMQMTTLLNYPSGYSINKFRNVSSTGTPGSNLTFADLDIPFFRLADVYLMYAEASLQNGDGADASTYVNKVRERAGAPDMTNVTLDSVLAERGRELYCEGTRRTDLIRFGYFTGGTYLWPWKGGAANGEAIDAHLNLYPLPTTDLATNPNLKQNTGY